MSVRRLAAVLALLLTAGCSRGVDSLPPGPGPAPAPDQPIVLEVSPDTGTPGATVTATLRLQEPEQIGSRLTDGSFLGWICFRECGGGGASTSVTFTRSPSDPSVFRAEFIVPVMLRRNGGPGRFDPVAAGEYQVHAACILDHAPGCANRTDVSSTFQVSKGLDTVSWQQLPAAGGTPVLRLASMSTTSRSPQPGSQRGVECVAGNLDPRYGEAPPRLLLTDDAGQSLPPITFGKGGPLFGRHDYAGCGDVALDPANPDSYYILEAPNAGGTEPGATPWPQFTLDRGATWRPVPAPEGFEARKTFVGFSVTADGVTAWFSRANLEERKIAGEQIRGSFTHDGGKNWATVEPSCPGGSASCVWQVRDKPPMIREGLIRSVDGGKNWTWAALSSIPFSAAQFYVLEGSDGKVLEALNGSPTLYWGFMPLLRSEDGGSSWRWVDVPTPPGGWIETAGSAAVIRLDHDGALAVGKANGANPTRWYRLAQGSTNWTALEQ